MNTITQSSKNYAIEFLRAAAVLLVFMHHLHSTGVLSVPMLGMIGGWFGVQIFFVVSGYLIIQSAERYSLGGYFKQRFFRIYPAYIFWFIVTCAIFGYFEKSLHLSAFIAHLVFLQHFFPDAYFKYDGLRVSWTLTIEMIWYIVAIAVSSRFFKNPNKGLWLSIFISLLWIYAFQHKSWVVNQWIKGHNHYFFASNNVIAQLPFFFFGAWIAAKKPKFDNAGLFSIFLITIVFQPVWQSAFPNPIFLTGLGAAALFLLLQNISCRPSWGIRILSDISYSFYLIHYPIIILTTKLLSNKYHITIVAFFGTCLVSYLSYKLIEQPFINFAKRKSNTGSPAQTAII